MRGRAVPGAVQNMSPSETVDCHVAVSSEYAPLVPALTTADKEWLEYEIGVPGSVGDSYAAYLLSPSDAPLFTRSTPSPLSPLTHRHPLCQAERAV